MKPLYISWLESSVLVRWLMRIASASTQDRESASFKAASGQYFLNEPDDSFARIKRDSTAPSCVEKCGVE